MLADDAGPLITTPLVIAEASYLIDRQLGAAADAQFFRAIADGDLFVDSLTTGDYRRISDLIQEYADLPLGGTDASVIAVAERRGATTVATLDRRHFSVVRPAHVSALALVPDL